ncbi:GNAT family N-acetyltransferase [Commensalibacter oyaizuii]|uniref:GNAT family N-acetyltransferase n=1 Tax=Commensalibacter oyaizuii TaxID=3043873 RepID=A0ABT6Q3N6_9PROT|nr:GNAT family N-acetyltransferase [Commensalibacter sp. TBRC 16381]MDI2091725.1 GNAT family N-acetyltransferase [Commensalibacter sp. TBRC 16381]
MTIQFFSQPNGLEEYLSYLHVAGFPPTEGWSASAFKTLLEMSQYHICIDFDEQYRIRGFLLYSVVIDQAEIITFVVHPTYRGQKIGRCIINAFLQEIVEQRVSSIFLEVAENNAVAIRLYESCGFIKCGKRLNYYKNGMNAILMSKKNNLL